MSYFCPLDSFLVVLLDCYLISRPILHQQTIRIPHVVKIHLMVCSGLVRWSDDCLQC